MFLTELDCVACPEGVNILSGGRNRESSLCGLQPMPLELAYFLFQIEPKIL